MKRRLSLFFAAHFVVFGCHSVKKSSLGIPTASNFKYNFKLELTKADGSGISTFADSVEVFCVNSYFILRIPIPLFEITQSQKESHVILTETEKLLTINYEYLIIDSLAKTSRYIKRDASGLSSFLINADSVLQKRLPAMKVVIDSQTDSLTQINEKEDWREEQYTNKFKRDETYPDSTVLIFRKSLQALPFSFSPELDSSRGMKLCSVRFITKSHYSKGFAMTIPQREFSFRIETISLDITDTTLMGLLRR